MSNPCAFSPNERHARQEARFVAAMFPKQSRVLDVGFGQGYFLEEASAAGLRPFGLDRDKTLVDSAHGRGLDAIHGTVQDISAADAGALDGVVGSHIIEHLTTVEVAGFLDEIRDSLRDQGSVVLVTPNSKDFRVISHWFWNDPTHVRLYTAETLQAMLDPTKWLWQDSGTTPLPFNRDSLRRLPGRVRFGPHYGRAGVWFKFAKQDQ